MDLCVCACAIFKIAWHKNFLGHAYEWNLDWIIYMENDFTFRYLCKRALAGVRMVNFEFTGYAVELWWLGCAKTHAVQHFHEFNRWFIWGWRTLIVFIIMMAAVQSSGSSLPLHVCVCALRGRVPKSIVYRIECAWRTSIYSTYDNPFVKVWHR